MNYQLHHQEVVDDCAILVHILQVLVPILELTDVGLGLVVAGLVLLETYL